jgi:phosphoenolpyruvate synthase/pyruvate phosphate dikinase
MTISVASTRTRATTSRRPPASWRGTPASAGVGRGGVRFVRDVGDALAAPPGSVLVADVIPAAWVPLLRRPAAVLVGRGGALSNTATALRERRVPALAGVAGLAGLLDGDQVEVDGGAGTARRL